MGRPRSRVIISSKEIAANENLVQELSKGPVTEADAFERFALPVLCVVLKQALHGDINAARLYLAERARYAETQAKLKRPAVRVLEATSDASDFGPRSVS